MSSPEGPDLDNDVTVPVARSRPEPEPAREPEPESGDRYVAWLADNAMLERASKLAQAVTKTRGAHRPFAEQQPRAASALAPAWLTVYPASHLARPGESVLAALGDEQLWTTLLELGIRGMHTGPMKRSGGVTGRTITPTIDGHFDRIAMEIDAAFGTETEYVRLTGTAKKHGAIVIGDIIPGHTGKGFDFRLAERAYRDYPGLYQMVEIDQADWSLLPPVPPGKDSVNLAPHTLDQLVAKGYVPGRLQRTIFYTKGVKETDFSATDVVVGVDGRSRRWVYLHYFKDGQPTLDWLDPSFGAQRLVLGDAVHSLRTLGDSMLRLDANGFLGIEPRGEAAWSEGHPLSLTSNQLIAGLVRRLGGFTFQELNLTFDELRGMSHGGADLSYDFVTRPAYHHAFVTGDTGFLRLVLQLQKTYDIDPAALVHALQNHDELTLELVHFFDAHANDTFEVRGTQRRGGELREQVIADMHAKLIAPNAPYNLEATNGVACTTPSLVAAALGVHDLTAITAEQRAQIQQGHLLLAMYNALQPGVFAISGWDLVGALPLPKGAVADLIADGDVRWIQRGAYDLLGTTSEQTSASGLPRAPALYGPLPAQLADPSSFASQLRRILKTRERYRIHESRQIAIPETRAPGLLVLVHELPDAGGIEITALNFGRTAVDETIAVPAAAGRAVSDLLAERAAGSVGADGALRIQLAPLQGTALHAR